MDNNDIAQEWFKIAAADLASGEYLQKMHPIPIEIICYHCQQSTEKYLKGYLALKGEEIQKTHDLIQLNKSCQKYDFALSSQPNFSTLCFMLFSFAKWRSYLLAGNAYQLSTHLLDLALAS